MPRSSAEPERLHKLLARAGVASLRASELLIASGRVAVNGNNRLELGVKVDPTRDRITLDGKSVSLLSELHRYLVLHKPTGVTSTTSDRYASKTVLDLAPSDMGRLYPVGRLDRETSGLLLLTNDGAFANLMMHPRHHVPRVYRARVKGILQPETLDVLRSGVDLEDGKTQPSHVRRLPALTVPDADALEITVFEGRNRQVRRMLEAVGHPVTALCRVAIGPLKLGRLPRGRWREMTRGEVEQLRALALRTTAPAV
ncbi:MAG: rRNA pseudouridine synthase [Armatimonadetes bacterium]|nr:rRNA pseudouridine synthase [Armatimonadota bacterium]MDE2205413.1 rRNA pseudouridine synthase [Armatimonadota bacterium]